MYQREPNEPIRRKERKARQKKKTKEIAHEYGGRMRKHAIKQNITRRIAEK